MWFPHNTLTPHSWCECVKFSRDRKGQLGSVKIQKAVETWEQTKPSSTCLCSTCASLVPRPLPAFNTLQKRRRTWKIKLHDLHGWVILNKMWIVRWPSIVSFDLWPFVWQSAIKSKCYSLRVSVWVDHLGGVWAGPGGPSLTWFYLPGTPSFLMKY